MKRRRGRRLLVSLVIFLIGLELCLHFAHLLSQGLRPRPRLLHPGAPVILCLGDSHTYGVKLPATQSYPSQLQALFEAKGIAVNVINLGIPGQNSSELRRSLPALLSRYHPRAVALLIGANNDWNRHEVAWSDWQDGTPNSGVGPRLALLGKAAVGSLRTVRLASYVWSEYLRKQGPEMKAQDREGRAYLHDWRGKGHWDSPGVLLARTRRDLTAMVDRIREAGADPVLLTYVGQPFSPMTLINQGIRDAATARGVFLVDNDADLHPRFIRPDGTMDQAAHDRLFIPESGETHLAGPGYALVARNVLETLEPIVRGGK